MTLEVHKEARRIAEHYGFRLYDSCILAFALPEDCEVLYNEDRQHGQVIFDRLTVVNPFRSPNSAGNPSRDEDRHFPRGAGYM